MGDTKKVLKEFEDENYLVQITGEFRIDNFTNYEEYVLLQCGIFEKHNDLKCFKASEYMVHKPILQIFNKNAWKDKVNKRVGGMDAWARKKITDEYRKKDITEGLIDSLIDL